MKVECKICGKMFDCIPVHLRKHGMTKEKYLSLFPGSHLISKQGRLSKSRDVSGSKNPMFGKKHSEETKRKIAKDKIGNKTIAEKVSKTRKKKGLAKGLNNPMFGKKHSEETKRKMSDIRTKAIATGKHNKSFHKKGYFKSERLKKEIWHDSSYELEALKILENDLLVIDFDRNKLRIPYFYNKSEKKTVPDFWIKYWDGREKIIEVKPQRKIDQIKQERIKIEAITNYCMKNDLLFTTWTEKNLGILRG